MGTIVHSGSTPEKRRSDRQEELRKEVELFKDDLDFVKTILTSDKEVKLFMFCKAMKELSKSMPNSTSLYELDGFDFSHNAAESIDKLTEVLKNRVD
jgi:hypothetical protein